MRPRPLHRRQQRQPPPQREIDAMKQSWIRSLLSSKTGQNQILVVLLLLALSIFLTGCELPIKLCGDQKCDTARGETYEWCSRDCRCGSGGCDANENPENCPNDCLCGDGRCQQAYGESSETCPGDCPAACGDGVCDKEGGETPWSCEVDCGNACGNGVCQPEYGEFGSTCPEDCAR